MKTRLNIYLSAGQHEEIAALAAKRRVSKSSVIEAAVASILSPDSADMRETLGRRLQRGNSLVREISLEIWPEQRSNGVRSAVPSEPNPGAGDIVDAR